MPVTFHTADIKFSLRNRVALRKFIEEKVRKSKNLRIDLSFVFCSDEYLLNINRQFLKHDYYTDIITFPLSEDKEHIEAEIYISVERVRENSEKFKVVSGFKEKVKVKNQKLKGEESFHAELHRVMFHGVLHLLGYKDKTKSNRLEMRKMEDVWIKRFEKGKT